MKGHFYFGKFRDGMLLTGDTGCWRFLTKDQFAAFMNDAIPVDSSEYQALEAEHFCYHGSQEAFIQDSLEEIRSGNSYLFEATSLFIIAVTNECNIPLFIFISSELDYCLSTIIIAYTHVACISMIKLFDFYVYYCSFYIEL